MGMERNGLASQAWKVWSECEPQWRGIAGQAWKVTDWSVFAGKAGWSVVRNEPGAGWCGLESRDGSVLEWNDLAWISRIGESRDGMDESSANWYGNAGIKK